MAKHISFYDWKMVNFYYSGIPGKPSVDAWLSKDPEDFFYYNTRMLEARYAAEVLCEPREAT